MPKFSTQVALMGPDYRPVSFAPGDEVPEWALDQVGEHVLVPEGEASDAENDAPNFTGGVGASDENADEAGDDEDGDDEADKPADAPDFTAPAPRRGRARKQ